MTRIHSAPRVAVRRPKPAATRALSGPKNAPLKGTDPALVKLALSIVKGGGAGRWFVSKNPWQDPAAPQSFFLMTALPNKPDPKSPMLLLQTAPTRAYLGSLLDQGVPLMLGTLPLGVQVYAAALGNDVKLAADGLKAGGIKNHQAAVLLQPSASKFVVAHELQHWKDFEDPQLDASFERDMKHFFDAKYLSTDDKAMLMHFMWELRGHNAEALQAIADEKAGAPYLNGAGRVETTPKERKDAYAFEVGQAQSLFVQAYQSSMFRIIDEVRKAEPSQLKALVAIYSKYDLSSQPGAPLSFAKMVPPKV